MATDIVGSKMKSATGYGNANYTGPASDAPGTKTCADFEASKDGPEGVRGKLAAEGFKDRSDAEAGSVADLSRKITIQPQADAHGMESARARQAGDLSVIGKVSTLPGELANDEAAPVRQPE